MWSVGAHLTHAQHGDDSGGADLDTGLGWEVFWW